MSKAPTKKKARTTLTNEHKQWLVQRWACYGRSSEVRAEFERQFGFSVAERTANLYNLQNRDDEWAEKNSMTRWMPVYREARDEFLASVAHIPIAQAAYRLQKLDEMFARAWERNNMKTAMDILERAAKEAGGAYEAKRVVEGFVEHRHTHEEVPIDAQRSVIAEKIGQAIAALVHQQQLKPAVTINQ